MPTTLRRWRENLQAFLIFQSFEQGHARAFRQYDAADPVNRLVAGQLEARWNKALARVAEIEGKIATHDAAMPTAVVDPQELATLAADLKTIWSAPSSDARIKKIYSGELGSVRFLRTRPTPMSTSAKIAANTKGSAAFTAGRAAISKSMFHHGAFSIGFVIRQPP